MKRKKITTLITCLVLALNLTFTNGVLVRANESSSDSATDTTINNTSNLVINGIRVNKQLISRNYSKGEYIKPKYIIIHDTDNRGIGATAMANRNYFANDKRAEASTHFVVDESNIVEPLEETWKGWHIGDGHNAEINNDNSIGIELCVNKGNDFSKTLENGIALTKYLMKKYNIQAENVVRHKDASGKTCPRMMIEDNPNLWDQVKNKLSNLDTSESKGELKNGDKESKDENNINQEAKNEKIDNHEEKNISEQESKSEDIDKNQVGVSSEEIDKDKNIENNQNTESGQGIKNSQKAEKDEETKTEKVEINSQGKVINVRSNINVRKDPTTGSMVLAYLRNGTKVKVNYELDGWYNVTVVGNKDGFIKKEFIELLNYNGNTQEESNENNKSNESEEPKKNNLSEKNNISGKGKIINVRTGLNVRQKKSTDSKVMTTLAKGQKVDVKSNDGQWANIIIQGRKGQISGYVKSDFIDMI